MAALMFLFVVSGCGADPAEPVITDEMIPWFTATADYLTLGTTRLAFTHQPGVALIDPVAGTVHLVVGRYQTNLVALSPDAGRVAFVVRSPSGTHDIHVRDTRTGAEQVVAVLAQVTVTHLDWSADGAKVFFATKRLGVNVSQPSITIRSVSIVAQPVIQDLYSIDAGLSLVETTGIDVNQAGDVLFAQQQNPNAVMQVQRAGGVLQTLINIVDERPLDRISPLVSPVWSPDGARIAFFGLDAGTTAPGDETTALVIMDSDGSNAHTILSLPGAPEIYTLAPVALCWTGDGSRITFMLPEANGGSYEIKSVLTDGTGVRTIVGIDRSAETPYPGDNIHGFSCSRGAPVSDG